MTGDWDGWGNLGDRPRKWRLFGPTLSGLTGCLHLLCSPFPSLEATRILPLINGKSTISSSRQPGLQAGIPERRGTLPPPCMAYRGLLTVLHAMPGV